MGNTLQPLLRNLIGNPVGGKYRTKKHPRSLQKNMESFVQSLIDKGYTTRGAKMLFSKEEKKDQLIHNTRSYKKRNTTSRRSLHKGNVLANWREFLENYKKKVKWSPSSKKPYKQLLQEASKAYHK